MRNVRKYLPTIFLILIFLMGVGLILYPTLANWWNERLYQHAMVEYTGILADSKEDAAEEMMKSAREYNERLARVTGNRFTDISEQEREEYSKQLSLQGDQTGGMMGYLEIPSIDTTLPIYHGSDDAVLASGVGHLEGTSLPVGGEGTHAVLSGHRGLPSAKLLTDLNKVELGERFYIDVLNEKLVYEVDQILTVLPDEVEYLQIVKGMDYCTLVTCTPYGVNTHRLLVRGHRVFEEMTDSSQEAEINHHNNILGLLPFVVAGVMLVVMILLLVPFRKKKNESNEE